MKILKQNGFSKNIRFIRARVPVLKATCSFTGIDVDITVKNQKGFPLHSCGKIPIINGHSHSIVAGGLEEIS